MEANDWPDLRCPCCECHGKMCFVDHPGHSHRVNYMTPTICDNCGKEIPFMQIRSSVLGVYTPEKTYTLCGYDCMTELGWKLRETQPKLSKSRIINDN